MAARAPAGDAELLRIHPVLRGVVPNETHRPMNIRYDLGNIKLRLRAVNDGKRRVTSI